MSAAELASRIKGSKQKADGQWSGCCPAHDDRHASLTWGDGKKGLVIRCHAGCTLEKIAEALNVPVSDFFYSKGHARSQIVKIYNFTDEHGVLVLQEVRFEPKDFRVRRPDGRGGWIWNLKGIAARPPYRLPDLKGHKTVAIVEGPKDADTLWDIDIPATTNAGGAGKWTDAHTAYLVAAGVEEVLVFRDNDKPGAAHALSVARSCVTAGLRVKRIDLPGLPPIREKHGEDVTDWLALGHTKDELLEVMNSAPEVTTVDLGGTHTEAEPSDFVRKDLWAAARPVSDLLRQTDTETVWLEEPLLAPNAVTEMFSPRGLGKTLVAYAVGLKLAKEGKRVLLADRDNPPREIKRRLRAWGGSEASTFKVMTRGQVPPLTDGKAWAQFPVPEYDLVIIDSLDSTTEGVGEKDSAKPSRALKPVLDLAHRENGPAVLILGNTIRSGQRSRGSGVIEDRADLCFEVRDATDFTPTGTKDWWHELPSADAAEWGQRATRRKRRATYRLAFISTKCRLAEDLDPFILEIDLSSEPWVLRNVTTEVVTAGIKAQEQAEQVRQSRTSDAAGALSAELHRRAEAGEDWMLKNRDAEPFLMGLGLTRKAARTLTDPRRMAWPAPARESARLACRGGRSSFSVSRDLDRRLRSERVAAESSQSETSRKQTTKTTQPSADRINTGRRKPESRQPAPAAAIREDGSLPPSDPHTPGTERELSTGGLGPAFVGNPQTADDWDEA